MDEVKRVVVFILSLAVVDKWERWSDQRLIFDNNGALLVVVVIVIVASKTQANEREIVYTMHAVQGSKGGWEGSKRNAASCSECVCDLIHFTSGM